MSQTGFVDPATAPRRQAEKLHRIGRIPPSRPFGRFRPKTGRIPAANDANLDIARGQQVPVLDFTWLLQGEDKMVGKVIIGSIVGLLGGFAALELGIDMRSLTLNVPGLPSSYEVLALFASAGAFMGVALGVVDR
jgi:hypothetical protein